MYGQEEATRDPSEMEPTETDQEEAAESTAGDSPKESQSPTGESLMEAAEKADPQSSADATAMPDPTDPSALAGELESLRQELRELREALASPSSASNSMQDELAELRALYPEVSAEQLPDEVWSDARRGIPLAAAYALSCRRKERMAEEAKAQNTRNACRSSGALREHSADYFTPEDVRAMTPAEVHRNYDRILLSMQKWRYSEK